MVIFYATLKLSRNQQRGELLITKFCVVTQRTFDVVSRIKAERVEAAINSMHSHAPADATGEQGGGCSHPAPAAHGTLRAPPSPSGLIHGATII